MNESYTAPRPLLVVADRVHTLHRAGVTALLVKDGRIAATGTADELRLLAPDPELLDLRGTTITPGLTDAHVHLTEWAFARFEVDLAHATSPSAAARGVADHLAQRPLPWIRGRGWNPHLWGGQEPHRRILDDAVSDRPVALQSHDMHALWVNTAALVAAGIDATTPDPDGGRIVRDATGEATGLLLEWAGRLVTAVFPAPTPAQAVYAVHDAQTELHSLGITGVHSFPGVHLTEPDPLPVLLTLREQDQLRLRILQHIRLERLDDAIRLGLRSGFGDGWLRIGALKMFLDGALGSRTAWMRAPYEGDTGVGMSTMEPGVFRENVRRAAEAGIASTVHAIGDAAVCLALDVLCSSAHRVAALPHRIEHVQCCPVDRFGDAAAAGVTCSVQPAHLITDWHIADRHWGAERSRGAFAVGSLLRRGTVLAFGSDAPVEPVDPRLGLHAALTRQDLHGQPPGGWFPDERIGALDALRGYTVGPARAAGLPLHAGTLAPGAAADFAAWDCDLVESPEDILRMRCVTTVVAGAVVHTR
jgi:predicted amidohydrolase YtcJ